MMPPPPARFSTTTACPQISVSCLASCRASRSVPPPTPTGRIIWTSRSGYAAAADSGITNEASVSAMAQALQLQVNFFIATPNRQRPRLPFTYASVESASFTTMARRGAAVRIDLLQELVDVTSNCGTTHRLPQLCHRSIVDEHINRAERRLYSVNHGGSKGTVLRTQSCKAVASIEAPP